ncbi:MAG TPA: threonine synthase [Chitinophagaceae bacterium]|nr:threonine synthase [Chitinophagaceae bacterium]
MKFYSLNKKSPAVDFKEATIRGQASDKGLYFPEHIPVLHKRFFETIREMDNSEIAFHVIRPYVEGCIPEAELRKIVKETIDFPIPLVQVNDRMFSLELYHGPTLAFKDVGARFMSRCLGYFSREKEQKVVVLVATSGDTGGAVAHGFYNVEGVEVVILYPSGKVSAVQEKQLTTLGMNIHTLEVEGSFDDCQRLVKQAFADEELQREIFLTSANSINVARWLPQQFYYFLAYKQWAESTPPVFCVPSGNFGNICAGILAYVSGLPVKHFIAACNANDVVPAFLQTGQYRPKNAVATISNAMDVGDPSNFIRMLELFQHKWDDLHEILSSYSITDDETKLTIQKVYKQYAYVLDPHGAVAYASLERYLNSVKDDRGIFLETAHPVKFYNIVEPVIHKQITMPPALNEIVSGEKNAVKVPAEYKLIKDFIRRTT